MIFYGSVEVLWQRRAKPPLDRFKWKSKPPPLYGLSRSGIRSSIWGGAAPFRGHNRKRACETDKATNARIPPKATGSRATRGTRSESKTVQDNRSRLVSGRTSPSGRVQWNG